MDKLHHLLKNIDIIYFLRRIKSTGKPEQERTEYRLGKFRGARTLADKLAKGLIFKNFFAFLKTYSTDEFLCYP